MQWIRHFHVIQTRHYRRGYTTVIKFIWPSLTCFYKSWCINWDQIFCSKIVCLQPKQFFTFLRKKPQKSYQKIEVHIDIFFLETKIHSNDISVCRASLTINMKYNIIYYALWKCIICYNIVSYKMIQNCIKSLRIIIGIP